MALGQSYGYLRTVGRRDSRPFRLSDVLVGERFHRMGNGQGATKIANPPDAEPNAQYALLDPESKWDTQKLFAFHKDAEVLAPTAEMAIRWMKRISGRRCRARRRAVRAQ